MRIICLIAAGVFTRFALWQINDLEQYGTEAWYGWLLGYALVAVLSLYSLRGPMARWVYASVAVLAAIGAAIRATDIEWRGVIFYNPTNPAGNETGGLVLVALWMVALVVWASRPNTRHAQAG